MINNKNYLKFNFYFDKNYLMQKTMLIFIFIFYH